MWHLLLLAVSLVSPICQAMPDARQISVRLNTDPPTLDWNRALDSVSNRVNTQLMEGLTTYDDELKPLPALARSWETSRDGMTYTFHLRKDVRWSDGVPLKAQDFVNSWTRLLDPKTAAPGASLLYDVKGAEEFNHGKIKDAAVLGVHALDEITLEVRLKQRANYFPSIVNYMATFPVRLDLISKLGDAWTRPENLVTLGPYRLSERKAGQFLVLKRNATYYGKVPALESVRFVVVTDDSTAVSLFEAGQLDLVIGLPPEDISRLSKTTSFHLSDWLRSSGYRFNVLAKPFDDVRVRHALAAAINHDDFKSILKNLHTPRMGWLPKGIPGYSSQVGIAYDPGKAKKLLEEAGYPGGRGFPKVSAYFDSRADNRIVAERLQSIWKETLGIVIDFIPEDYATFVKHYRTDAPQLFRAGYGMIYPDPHDLLSSLATGLDDRSGWKNLEFDNLVKKAESEPSPGQRARLYEKAEAIVVEKDVSIIPLFQESLPYLMSDRIKKIRIAKAWLYLKDSQ